MVHNSRNLVKTFRENNFSVSYRVTYGDKLKESEDKWKWAEEILEVSVIELNRDTGFDKLELELLFDESTSDNEERIYRLNSENYERDFRVRIEDLEEDTGILALPYRPPDSIYTNFVEELGEAMTRTPYPEEAF